MWTLQTSRERGDWASEDRFPVQMHRDHTHEPEERHGEEAHSNPRKMPWMRSLGKLARPLGVQREGSAVRNVELWICGRRLRDDHSRSRRNREACEEVESFISDLISKRDQNVNSVWCKQVACGLLNFCAVLHFPQRFTDPSFAKYRINTLGYHYFLDYLRDWNVFMKYLVH